MTDKRDSRYSRTVGEPPAVGRRYVVNDNVRIEWTEAGQRRSRTVGANTPANRKKADKLLEEILSPMTDEQTEKAEDTSGQTEESAASTEMTFEIPQSLRDAAVRIMDAADDVADWIEDGISKIWSRSTDPDVEEAEVEEIRDEDESTDE